MYRLSKIKFNKELFSRIVNLLMRWGIPYRESAVYAYLLLSPKEELSIKEISEISGLSISSVSYSLRQLQGKHMVEISRKIGKIKYYVPKPVFSSILIKEPEVILKTYTRPIIELLDEELKEHVRSKEHARKLEETINDLKKLDCMLTKILELFRSSHECQKW